MKKLLALPVLLCLASLLPTTTMSQSRSITIDGAVIDCSRIQELGIDRQANLRAARIRVLCGLESPGAPGAVSAAPEALAELAAPANVDTITNEPANDYPHVTQSESMVWSSDGNTIVVNYNDSRTAPSNYSGVSVSTNGGNTFTRLLPSPFASGHGTNYGDPIVVYNAKLSMWFAGDLATGCGGQGIGLWTSTDPFTNWSTGVCAHSGGDDDRESMWVDNNPSSPFYGRMYISWNDFAAGQGIFVTHSDDGVAWTSVQVTTSFIRNVQVTGGADGTVFVAGMNEGGGGLGNRTNLIYRSTDGGSSWTAITMGSSFAAPGDSTCPSNSYFARITPIWRHMGWGQPGVGPGSVVHYAYAGAGSGADTGDIYYTRSTDNGSTWSTPIRLNTDGGTNAQWMPSLSVTSSGDVHVHWYDRRNTTDGQNYEVWSRRSADNGVTWLPDEPVSAVLIPQPEQPDGSVQACYAGDYNYATALGSAHYATWTDGRVLVSGHSQQDVFFATVSASPPAPDYSVSLNPSSLTIPQGGSGTSTTTIASTGGFNNAVTLACSGSGQPAGVTCAFVPDTVTPPPNGSGTSVLTINVAASVPAGTYGFNVVGTSGALTHTALITLQVTTRQITVTAPNGGETWPINSNQTISWTSSGVSGKVKVDLSRDGGTSWEILVSSTANNGKRNWRVTAPATNQGLIRVCDLSGSVCDTSNANFTIQ